jgi:hypothetical protein
MLSPLIALWALVGWCGNEPIRIRLVPHGPTPPEPDPEPNWLVSRLIGVVAGVIGGFVFRQVFGASPELGGLSAGPHPEPWALAVYAAATTVGAYVVSRIVTDIYGQMRGGNVNRG